MAFRTLEVSEPQFESENLRFITVKTSSLKGRGDICLFLPSTPETKKIPLIILLHGVYGSSWAWAFKGGVHRTAQSMITGGIIQPVAIAMPSDGLWGDGSGYFPHHHLDFENWIVNDVPAAVQQVAGQVDNTSRLFIAGLSMGGYGALRLGIKYSGRFAGISAHSAITSADQMAGFIEEVLEPPLTASVWEMAQKNKTGIPPLRFDCGTEDNLLPHNRVLHENLERLAIPHLYREYRGAHDWDYWQNHVSETLLFFDRLGRPE